MTMLTIALYAAMVAIAALAAWSAPSPAIRWLAALLAADFTASNVALWVVGYAHEPLLVPSIDAVVAIGVAIAGLKYRSLNIAGSVFMLFGALGVVHVMAIGAGLSQSYTYYALKNAIFLAQVSIIGGAGVAAYFRSRTDRRDTRPGADPVGGLAMAARPSGQGWRAIR